jgi:hydroxymethylpyrimidine pyrophosphatase-like HAD family hydrolase
MGKFDGYLICSDVDGTFHYGNTIEGNSEAVRYFTENGGAFTVNTGRSAAMFGKYMDLIGANVPYLLWGGSAAYDHRTGQLSDVVPLELELEETMALLCKEFPEFNVELQAPHAHFCFNAAGDWHGFYENQGFPHFDAAPGTDYGPFIKFSVYGHLHAPKVADLYAGSQEEIDLITAAGQRLEALFGDKVEIFRPAPRILDIHARGVSKLKAARVLQKKLGRKYLVCVGDAENDLSMLLGADFAFVPSDAILKDSFPNVCACGQGAVADVIYKKIPEILGIKP